MRVVQATFGVFHQFALARQLHRRGHLERIFSTWPWQRLAREGIPRNLVETFPWVHLPQYVLGRWGLNPLWLDDALGYANALTFDRFTRRRLPPCDAFIALSGAGLATGKLVQQRGGIFVCDRGSSHQRFQQQIVSEEYRRWGVHTPVSDPRDTRREELIYAQADAITVPSTFAAESFVQMGVPASKLHVIPYGVELKNFSPAPGAAGGPPPLDGPNSRFEVLFVGGVNLRKGIPYLLEAFARLDHPRKRLRILGHIAPEIKPVLAQLPQQHVECLGSQGREAVLAAMRSSHLLVLPSIEEGLALVQAEALACGCPVLATHNTGAAGLFTSNVEGFIVPIRDPAALLDRMAQVAASPALHARLRQAALTRVQSLCGWDTYGDRWDALLQQLISSATPRP